MILPWRLRLMCVLAGTSLGAIGFLLSRWPDESSVASIGSFTGASPLPPELLPPVYYVSGGVLLLIGIIGRKRGPP